MNLEELCTMHRCTGP